MLTIDEIRNISFRKANFSGYKPEDVDDFIDEVLLSFEEKNKENESLIRKLEILAKRVEEYREEEESIRSTLLNAQKLADASVREAKHKAEVILKDASVQAERLVASAQKEVLEQQEMLDHLKSEVSSFRTKLLSIYKEHLTLIDALPAEEEAQDQPAAEEEAPQPQPQATEEAPVPPIVEEEPADMLLQQEGEPTPEAIAQEFLRPDVAQEEEFPSYYSSSPETKAKYESLQFGEDYSIRED